MLVLESRLVPDGGPDRGASGPGEGWASRIAGA
jgi:hypothetical protein